MKRDLLGSQVWLKKLLFIAVGLFTYPLFRFWNPLRIRGMDVLRGLPANGVLFVSSHQTYFADVIAMIHAFSASSATKAERLPFPWHLRRIRTDYYYVAAEETMQAGLLPRVLAYGGSINTRRTFREAGKDISKQARLGDFSKVFEALDQGWVITFPQGTTTPYAKGRRGVCHIVRQKKPLVVPVVVEGFRHAFGKRGLSLNNPGRKISLTFKSPLQFADGLEADEMLLQIMTAIEQIPPAGYASSEESGDQAPHAGTDATV